MKALIFVVVLAVCVHSRTAVTHSLKYFYTGSSEIKNFPEFVTVGLADDVPFTYYDSGIKKEIPKQDWMAENEGPEYWESNTQYSVTAQQIFKDNINIVKQRFNQTGGVHIVQYMYGCEWDDETQQVTGYQQHGYDGEDFMIWDRESNRWVAPKQQAVITTNKWNNNEAELEYYKNYLNQECPEWLKKYVDYGRSSLMKTDLPSVSFLQKTSSSPVSCHATGFYPNRAEMIWKKDGEEIHDGVVKGEILPNNDGTFQMTVDIDLSSVTSEDWTKYECVFQLSGLKEDITKRLEKTSILANKSNPTNAIIIIIIIPVVVAVAVLGIIGVIGFIKYKTRKNIKKGAAETKSSTSSFSSDKSDESQGSASSEKPLLQ